MSTIAIAVKIFFSRVISAAVFWSFTVIIIANWSLLVLSFSAMSRRPPPGKPVPRPKPGNNQNCFLSLKECLFNLGKS